MKVIELLTEVSVAESADLPILVSMLKRTIADHVKNKGQPVKLLDKEIENEPMKISGYQLRPDGSLELSVIAQVTGHRYIVYTKDMLDDGRLHFQKGSNGRLLVYSNEAN